MHGHSPRSLPTFATSGLLLFRYLTLFYTAFLHWGPGTLYLTLSAPVICMLVAFLFGMVAHGYGQPFPPLLLPQPMAVTPDPQTDPLGYRQWEVQQRAEAARRKSLSKAQQELEDRLHREEQLNYRRAVEAWKEEMIEHERQFAHYWVFLKVFFTVAMAQAIYTRFFSGIALGKETPFYDGWPLIKLIDFLGSVKEETVKLIWEPLFVVSAGLVVGQWSWPLCDLLIGSALAGVVVRLLMWRAAWQLKMAGYAAHYDWRWMQDEMRGRPEEDEEPHVVRPRY